ncbi:hypothetical protein BN10_990022 [Phycicoccus elongatus Lp2]|uniref:Uncharacterized protein n=1 Tax=Phycicoccus elongatus Lp2 TaxID=1193181 RepID=N0E3S9_9MICO|nr:hypothetical protein BN10_990022 [Phycicoccus elongatus Lp2]
MGEHRRACLVRDELALGEDRSLEAPHLLDGPAGAAGDLLGAEPRADEGLDIARTQAPLDLDLQLAQARPVPTGGGTQGVVERQTVSAAVAIGEEEVITVLVDADQLEVLHACFASVVMAVMARVLLDSATVPRIRPRGRAADRLRLRGDQLSCRPCARPGPV